MNTNSENIANDLRFPAQPINNNRFSDLPTLLHSNDTIEEHSHRVSKLKLTKSNIIITGYTLTVLSLIAIYIGLLYFFINKYYTKPNEIKNNQIDAICNVTDIVYMYNGEIIVNNTIVTTYKISKAYGDTKNIRNVNMIKLVKNFTCETTCVDFILKECVVYIKNSRLVYLAANKDVIEGYFSNISYISFIISESLALVMLVVTITVCVFYDRIK